MSAAVVIVVIVIVVIAGVLTKRGGVRRVLAYAASQGWEMLIIDSFSKSEYETECTCYAVRFRERDGALVEGVLESHPDGLRLAKSIRLPRDVAHAILDKRLPMDCRKCGTSIPAGAERCPYCHGWRYELRIA